ncbi:hypothetical protein E5676_scaffold832G001460 [Cucumis melo var. makuwa]|uniref:Uncharacterized protein n=1 Tax=Cucumis melo var. makuwa TaxID=1194695 RepID=A0A5D3CSC3_CUCMM|nr:hypothetical protein E5676_scaffold832G001460 [Cucumis melo var. makuwa]
MCTIWSESSPTSSVFSFPLSFRPVCPRCSFGITEDQLCSSGITCYTCSGTYQFLGEGKGRGKLASDREGSVTCYMGTQFCFRFNVLIF